MTAPEEESSLLAPLSDEYLPGPGERERLRAAVFARVAQETSASDEGRHAAQRSWALRAGLYGSGILAVIGALVVLQTRADRDGVVPSPAPIVVREAAPAHSISTPAASESLLPVLSVSVDSLPSAAPARPVRGTPGPSAAIDEGDALTRETALLVTARGALRDSDGARALEVLDQHARDFPRGFLATERAVERIRALCLLGRTEDARREARPFLDSENPHPLARQVKSTCVYTGDESRTR